VSEKPCSIASWHGPTASRNPATHLCYIVAMPSKHRFPGAALLFLAFLCQVCAAQAGPPTPPAHSAQPASTSKSNTPAPGTPTEGQPGTSTNPACPNGPCDYEPPHITSVNPPPAPTPDPWPLQERIKWLAVALLLLLSYPALLIAISALRKIERHTRYTETAAQAAADSAKAALLLAESQARADRPWILVSTKPTPGVVNGFSVVATNRGRSPARIVSLAEGLIIVQDEAQLPPTPVLKAAPGAPLAPIILLPGESATIKSFQRDEVVSNCEDQEQVLRVEDWKEKIYLYGKVVYADLVASGDETHDTGWCCWYIHGRQKSGMIMAGPLDYNRHT
jgi:hypothetical protein